MPRFVYGSGPNIPACLRGKLVAPPAPRPRITPRRALRADGPALPYWPLKTKWRQSPTMPELWVSPEGDVFLDAEQRSGYLVVQRERRRATFRHEGLTVSVRRLLAETWA